MNHTDNRSKDSKQQSQRKLIVKKINYNDLVDIETAGELLETHAEYQMIDNINWPSFPYRPSVKFKIWPSPVFKVHNLVQSLTVHHSG